MSTYRLPYFDEIHLKYLKDYYESEIEIHGKPVHLDLNIEEEKISKDRLDCLSRLLENLPNLVSNIEKEIQENYNNQEDGDVRFYIKHHLEELDESSLSTLGVDNNNQSKTVDKQLLEKLYLRRVGFYPEYEGEGFAVMDFTISEQLTDYLLVAYLGEDGELGYFAMES